MLKKILLSVAAIFTILVIVLGVHIYMVTRPKPADPNERMMVRVDFKNDISEADASKISEFLYSQKGVDHVLCNPESNIAVFTIRRPFDVADGIVANVNTTLPYQATRFLPSEKDLQSGCPVSKKSFSYRVYSFFKNI